MKKLQSVFIVFMLLLISISPVQATTNGITINLDKSQISYDDALISSQTTTITINVGDDMVGKDVRMIIKPNSTDLDGKITKVEYIVPNQGSFISNSATATKGFTNIQAGEIIIPYSVLLNDKPDSNVTLTITIVDEAAQTTVYATASIELGTFAKPAPEPATTTTWDDGGPFTTDSCGSVFDRWGNEVYKAPVCAIQNTTEYKVPNTGVK